MNLWSSSPNDLRERGNTLRGSSTSQVLSLLLNGHEFKSSQGCWRLTWLLTSGPV